MSAPAQGEARESRRHWMVAGPQPLCAPLPPQCSGCEQLRDCVPSAALAKRRPLLFTCQAFGGDNLRACFALLWAGRELRPGHESWPDCCIILLWVFGEKQGGAGREVRGQGVLCPSCAEAPLGFAV